MKNEKNDLRSRVTRSVVKNALITLLADKPLKEITVSELCKAAQINRGTFYNHFYDIYDVYERAEEDILAQLYQKMESIRTDDLSESFFREILDLVVENTALVRFIVANLGENSLIRRVADYAKEKYVKDFRERYPHKDSAEIESLFTYIFNGSIALVAEWLKRDPPGSTDEIAKRIVRYHRLLAADMPQ